MPKLIVLTLISIICLLSCTPINTPTQSQQSEKTIINDSQKKIILDTTNNNQKIKSKPLIKKDKKLKNNITVLFSNNNKESLINQFINILELAVYNKKLNSVSFEIKYFENDEDLENIIINSKHKGNIFIGPAETKHTKIIKKYCDKETIFFSFSSDTNLATDCIFLLNFFPKNELEQLFLSLKSDAKVALLYPENNYGYRINLLIDEVINTSDAILVNRSSYKKDLSNVRDAIKELGKYELRKYELDRQKKFLSNKNDKQSKKRLKKLEKFKTTKDYDFTHILLADYGINLLQVAPLLPYYDIDPNVVQFLGTGVIDDDNFFYEPSLQGAIFPGVQKNNRLELLNQYKDIYNENLYRVSTLPYDLVGLLNYIYSRNLSINQTFELLNNETVKFDGIDGKFYFKNNIIERDLEILQIANGFANKVN